jgi:hypothetical protein
MVLGSLRDQLLYPTWSQAPGDEASTSSTATTSATTRPVPSDAELQHALETVRLGQLLERCQRMSCPGSGPLDLVADWSGMLSLGEQQRLAFGRLLLSKPQVGLPACWGLAMLAGACWQGATVRRALVLLMCKWCNCLCISIATGITAAAVGQSFWIMAQPPMAHCATCTSFYSQLPDSCPLRSSQVALVDEATSALDQTNEALLYKAAAAAGITLVSVGHRPALVKFHQRVMELQPAAGGWQVVPAKDYMAV